MGNIYAMKWMLIFSFMLISFSVGATEKSLLLTMNDGSVHAVSLSEEPQMTFPNDSLLVESANFSLKISRADFSLYTFTEGDFSDLKESDGLASLIYMNNDCLVLNGVMAKSLFSLVDMQGRTLGVNVKRMENEAVISLSGVSPGIYLLKLEKLTFKFVVK